MNKEAKNALKSYALELVVYAALVVGYFFLVLAFLDEWTYRVYKGNRQLYAALSLVFVVCQGVILEALTRYLLAWMKRRKEGG